MPAKRKTSTRKQSTVEERLQKLDAQKKRIELRQQILTLKQQYAAASKTK